MAGRSFFYLSSSQNFDIKGTLTIEIEQLQRAFTRLFVCLFVLFLFGIFRLFTVSFEISTLHVRFKGKSAISLLPLFLFLYSSFSRRDISFLVLVR